MLSSQEMPGRGKGPARVMLTDQKTSHSAEKVKLSQSGPKAVSVIALPASRMTGVDVLVGGKGPGRRGRHWEHSPLPAPLAGRRADPEVPTSPHPGAGGVACERAFCFSEAALQEAHPGFRGASPRGGSCCCFARAASGRSTHTPRPAGRVGSSLGPLRHFQTFTPPAFVRTLLRGGTLPNSGTHSALHR